MKKELKNLLLTGALVAGTLGSAVVFAQATSQTDATQTQAQPPIVGSVRVPQGAALYLDMAKVSLQAAVTAAQQATGLSASPTSVELEITNGYLVWQVVIGDQEVTVDAGDGQVLQTVQADMEEAGESEHDSMSDGDEGAEQEAAEEAGGSEDAD